MNNLVNLKTSRKRQWKILEKLILISMLNLNYMIVKGGKTKKKKKKKINSKKKIKNKFNRYSRI